MPVGSKHRQCHVRGDKQSKKSSKAFWNLKPRKRNDLLTCFTWTLRDKLRRNFDPRRPEDVVERFSESFAKGLIVKVGTWLIEVAKILPDTKEKDKAILLIRVQGGAPRPYRCPVARLSMKTGRKTDRAQERETDELIRSLLHR